MTTRIQLTIVLVLTLASLVLLRQASAQPAAPREPHAIAAASSPGKRPTTPAVRDAIGRIMTAVRAQATPNLCGFEVPASMFAHVR